MKDFQFDIFPIWWIKISPKEYFGLLQQGTLGTGTISGPAIECRVCLVSLMKALFNFLLYKYFKFKKIICCLVQPKIKIKKCIIMSKHSSSNAYICNYHFSIILTRIIRK